MLSSIIGTKLSPKESKHNLIKKTANQNTKDFGIKMLAKSKITFQEDILFKKKNSLIFVIYKNIAS